MDSVYLSGQTGYGVICPKSGKIIRGAYLLQGKLDTQKIPNMRSYNWSQCAFPVIGNHSGELIWLSQRIDQRLLITIYIRFQGDRGPRGSVGETGPEGERVRF